MAYSAASRASRLVALHAPLTQALPSSKQPRRLHQVLPSLSAAPAIHMLRLQNVFVSASQTPSGFKKPEVLDWQDNMLTNRATFIGVVIREVRIKYLDSGKIVANSSIKVNRPIQDDSWFYLEFWGDLAEVAAAHLKVDDEVFVSGSVWSEKVTGKDGVEKAFAKVVVQDLKFVKKLDKEAILARVQNLNGTALWEYLFKSPTEWLAIRGKKTSDRSPDFKHMYSNKALWLDNKYTPAWVKERLEKESGLILQTTNIFQTNHSDVFQTNHPVEETWKNFFTDPSRWWDNRSNKLAPASPDFRHKSTREGLWIDLNTPQWVKTKLAALDSKEKEQAA